MSIGPVISAPSAAAQGIAPGQSAKDTPARLNKGATDFEALLLAQMLKSARESGTRGMTGDEEGQENSTLVELGEQQFAQALASSGGLGIAKMVVIGLEKHADR